MRRFGLGILILAALCARMAPAHAMLAMSDPDDETLKKPAPLPEGASFETGPDPKLVRVVVSPDAKTIATLTILGKVTLWNAASGKEVSNFNAADIETHGIDFAPDGKTLFTGSSDLIIKQWDVETGKSIKEFKGHDGEIKTVVASPDGAHIASADNAGTIKIWDIKTGDIVHSMTGHGDNLPAGMATPTIDCMNWSPDGRVLVTEANDETARLWDAIGGKELHVLPQHDGSVAAVAISPNNRVGVSTRGRQTSGTSHLRVWDVATGKILRIINGHQDDITCLGFAPDGRTVFSGARDRTVRQWDVDSGVEIRRFRLTSIPANLAASADGQYLAVVAPREGLMSFSLSVAPVTQSKDPCKTTDEAWNKLANPDYDVRSVGFNYFLKALPPQQAVTELLRRAHAIPAANGVDENAQHRELIARLDDDNYSVRLNAFDELRELGGAVRAELSEAVKSPSTEVRARAAELLSAIGGPFDAREVLVTELLRTLGTPEARAALEKR